MPQHPPSTIKDVSSKRRAKLETLLAERAVLGYTFSYAKLLELSDGDAEAVMRCVAAFKEEDAKQLRVEYNDQISDMFMAEGLEDTLEHHDPFGRQMQFVLQPGSSSSCPRDKVIECAVGLGIDADKLSKAFAQATTVTSYTTLQCRAVSEKAKAAAEKAMAKRGKR